ncbi:MAG: ribosome biogenesis GTPase Der, partial [Proteobacteria bacterium]|nr:ribosome biogenesis GTPase Der [Pseudomonadota bacterium]
LRLRYITEAKARAPTVVIFVNKPAGLQDSYVGYLTNDLREAFDLQGVPIRIHLRKGDNPYAGRKSKSKKKGKRKT